MQFARNLLLTLGLCAIAACGGSDPKELCDEGCDRTCDGEEPRTSDEIAACKADCQRFADRVEATDCQDQADKLASCSEDYVCDPAVTTACAEETTDLARCFTAFCFDNPNDSACQ